jgi:hypothetical protein
MPPLPDRRSPKTSQRPIERRRRTTPTVFTVSFDSYKVQEDAGNQYFKVVGVTPLVQFTDSPREGSKPRRISQDLHVRSFAQSAARAMSV